MFDKGCHVRAFLRPGNQSLAADAAGIKAKEAKAVVEHVITIAGAQLKKDQPGNLPTRFFVPTPFAESGPDDSHSHRVCQRPRAKLRPVCPRLVPLAKPNRLVQPRPRRQCS